MPVRRMLTEAILTSLVVTAIAAASQTVVEVVQDRDEGLYEVGEKATFTVRIATKNVPAPEGTARYTLTLDGGRKIASGDLALGADPATVTGTLEQPGVLRCTIVAKVGGKKLAPAFAAAAFDPEEIQPTAVMPEDFDAFWRRQKAELAEVPIDPQLDHRPEASEACTVAKISLANIDDTRVRGWLAVPRNGKKAPAVLTLPAPGVYPVPHTWATTWGDRGFLAMGIIIHDFDVETPAGEVALLREGALAGYTTQGRKSRDAYYFRRAFLACVRAVDYLTSRPEWDGQHLIVNGSSQGGGLSLVLAGLDHRVTALAANMPGLCDHTGRLHGRPSGWPRMIPAADPGGKIARVSAYYDAVSFARRANCPALVTVGFIDRICPPMTVYSAFNVLGGPKEKNELLPFPRTGHAVPREWGPKRTEWIKRHAGL